MDEWEGRSIYNPQVNVVMPMAGRGRRLEHLGHKPLAMVNGKPMVQWAIESLGIQGRYIFVVQKQFEPKLRPLLERLKPGCVIISVDYLTDGAAQSVLLAREHIDNQLPLVTANCDQYLEWDAPAFMRNADPSGTILTYTMEEKDGSFCILDDRGRVTRVAEKSVISKIGTVGVYYFGQGWHFVEAADRMIAKNIRVNNEFYILPVYNELIAMGIKPTTYHLPCEKRHVWRIGVERELQEFLNERG
jgi:dTDP-glucose pyrophosphorylase